MVTFNAQTLRQIFLQADKEAQQVNMMAHTNLTTMPEIPSQANSGQGAPTGKSSIMPKLTNTLGQAVIDLDKQIVVRHFSSPMNPINLILLDAKCPCHLQCTFTHNYKTTYLLSRNPDNAYMPEYKISFPVHHSLSTT
jgi:hypothetical protein